MLPDRLRLLRKELGLTQKEFASKFNMSDARYNQYETGKRTPDYETLCIFANTFEVTVDYLLGRTDTRNVKQPEANPMLEQIEGLSPEGQKDLEKYLELLKMKEQIDKSKDETSSALEKDA